MTLENLLAVLPRLIAVTPADQLAAVMAQLAAAQSAAAARILSDRSVAQASNSATTEKDRYLSVTEVVDRFHVTPRWLYRNKKHLPHSQPTRKTLLFPEAAITKWFASRKGA